MDPNLKEWQVPPPNRMCTDSSILQNQLYELEQSSRSLRQHFAAQACVPAFGDDSSSSWKWKSWNKFDTEGFDDLFYAEEATYCSRKSLVFFASSLHTHPAYTSDNMHSPYVVLQIGLCHCSKLALLASKLLFWLFSRMVFFMVEQSCSCLQRLIACLANELLPPFFSMHCASVPHDWGCS